MPALIVAAAIVVFDGVSWLAWWQWRSCPWVATGWVRFVVVLLPVIGLVQVGFQAMADRYTYLSTLGVERSSSIPSFPVYVSNYRRSTEAIDRSRQRPRGSRTI